MLTTAVEFIFIIAVPLVLLAGGLVTLFAVGAFFYAAEHPDELKTRIEGLFRRPPKPPRVPGRDSYYKPYWLGGPKPSDQ